MPEGFKAFRLFYFPSDNLLCVVQYGPLECCTFQGHIYQRLAYKSQRETPDDRNIRRAGKLRDRLGWTAGIFNGTGGKPKGMHWQTFWRLQASHEAHVSQAMDGMWVKLGKSFDTLHRINEVTVDL